MRAEVKAVAAVIVCMAGGINSVFADTSVRRAVQTADFNIQLPGDAYKTTVSPNWEVDLNNSDPNQNQMSMAVSHGYVYVCIDYFDSMGDGWNNSLVMRRYDMESGAEEVLKITDLPDDFKKGYNNYYTIVSDDAQNLLVGLVSTYSTAIGTVPEVSDKAIVRLYRYDQELNAIDEKHSWYGIVSGLHIENKEAGVSEVPDLTWMERINWHKGDATSGEFEFSACIGWRANAAANRYQYCYCRFTASADGAELKVADEKPAIKSEVDFPGQLVTPDVALYPDGQFDFNYMVVSYCNMAVFGGNAVLLPPTLYNNADDKVHQLGSSKNEYCRGFNPVVHNGHVLAIYALQHDAGGAQFSLTLWPEKASFQNTVHLAALPADPFNGVSGSIYDRSIRQLAVATPHVGVSREQTGASVKTDLYVCAPGSGIASYTLTTPAVSTGIKATFSGDHTSISVYIEGGNLYVKDMPAAEDAIEIFDMSGRRVLITTCAKATSGISLDMLEGGVYLVYAGRCVHKILL